jgi:hypothetical protein
MDELCRRVEYKADASGIGSPPMQIGTLTEEREVPPSIPQEEFDGTKQARELKLWLRALLTFFNLRNHPQIFTSQANLTTQDWSSELRIVRGILLRCSQLSIQLLNLDASDETIFDEVVPEAALDEFVSPDFSTDVKSELLDDSLQALTVALEEAFTLCGCVLGAGSVSLSAWVNLEGILMRRLAAFEGLKLPGQTSSAPAIQNIPARLLTLAHERIKPAALGADLLIVFSKIFELLEVLRYVEKALQQDQPLKQTLPIFTLVYEEARALASFIKARTLSIEGLEKNLFDALDSTNYAITMELRKVFAHELVELSSLNQAPAIYVKVENAHGLLRDSLRQTAIALAQFFDPTIEGVQLFDAFQTKLEQSLVLRRDLWTLLQLVKRAEKEPEDDAVQRLLKNLDSFYAGSLHYLMFKDWESCEGFMEEIGAARDAAELKPVLHRFTAYLEALSTQVNMRAVLINHPFDYPEVKSKDEG